MQIGAWKLAEGVFGTPKIDFGRAHCGRGAVSCIWVGSEHRGRPSIMEFNVLRMRRYVIPICRFVFLSGLQILFDMFLKYVTPAYYVIPEIPEQHCLAAMIKYSKSARPPVPGLCIQYLKTNK